MIMPKDRSNIPKRNNWKFFENYRTSEDEYSMSDLIEYYEANMFNKTLMMFNWKDLPDKMTSFDMEKFTQLKGFTLFIFDEADGDRYYVLEGSKYDNITWNFEASKAIIVNPALDGLKQKYELGKNCVLIRNDYLCSGLFPIIEKNAIDISNTDISIKFAQFNTRFKTLFTSDDDNAKDSIDSVIADIWEGKKPVSIVTNNLYKKSIEGISYNTGGQSTDIKSLMELRQYQLAQFFMELGINANYNMKREAVSSEEFRMNDDALMPLIDQMLECRKMACKEINDLFGLKIDVELNSAWLKLAKEVVNKVEEEEAEVEKTEAEASKAEAEAKIVETQAEEPKEETEAEEIKEEGDNDGTEEDKSNS